LNYPRLLQASPELNPEDNMHDELDRLDARAPELETKSLYF